MGDRAVSIAGLLPGSLNRAQSHVAHIEQVARTEPLKNYTLKPGHIRPLMLDHGYFISAAVQSMAATRGKM